MGQLFDVFDEGGILLVVLTASNAQEATEKATSIFGEEDLHAVPVGDLAPQTEGTRG